MKLRRVDKFVSHASLILPSLVQKMPYAFSGSSFLKKMSIQARMASLQGAYLLYKNMFSCAMYLKDVRLIHEFEINYTNLNNFSYF